MNWELAIGARPRGNGTAFRVWAPDRRRVDVVIYEGERPVADYPLRLAGDGYWSGHVTGIGVGSYYKYRLDATHDRPDPASRFQPNGVHGPSAVVDPAFPWTDQSWRGRSLDELVIYELHVGTATADGTFDALVERLAYLRDLGITAIELLPVADFPGLRNWGYDGVALYAPARSYGGPLALKRLVDAAHAHELAVILDVVYNHLGPAGNYLRDFARAYFTDRHRTPWGEAINFDGPDSAGVRDFFVDNALYWAHEYHIDGFRLDATQEIYDKSPVHVLQQQRDRLRATLPTERYMVVAAEDGRNLVQLVRSASAGGWGLDAQWADDFNHSMRVTLTGKREDYYRDYIGGAEELATTIHSGWLYQGQPRFISGRPHGTSPFELEPPTFVHFIQNHDQVGNRAFGERLNHDVPPAAYRAATALLLLGPYTPLLFMGQEWAATSPFLFFTDHDPALGRLIKEGRQREFPYLATVADAEIPDPQEVSTFKRSKLRWEERDQEPHVGMLRLHQDLLRLRRELPACQNRRRDSFTASPFGAAGVLLLRRVTTASDPTLLIVANMRDVSEVQLPATPTLGASWKLILDTEARRYGGGMPAKGALYEGDSPLSMDGPAALVLVETS